MAQQQRIRWHLLNMGSTEDIHSVHFHGQMFSIRTSQEYRMGVYNLYPGETRHGCRAQPGCMASCLRLLGCSGGQQGWGMGLKGSGSAFAQHSAPLHCAMTG